MNSMIRIVFLPLILAALVVPAMEAQAQEQAQEKPSPHAGMMQPEGHSSELMQQVMAKRAEIQQLNQQLMEIQQNTMEANPELAQQRDELVALVDTKMMEAGNDPDASRERIEGLQSQLQGGELSQEQRQQVGQQMRQEMGSLQQAQQQALQDQEVQTRRDTLNEDLVAAMKEQNPETEQLIDRLQSAQQEYRQLATQAMQRGQSAGDGGDASPQQ